ADAAGTSPGRRPGRVPAPRRALPPGAPAPLLPDARLAPRRRGPRPGDAAARLARARPVRRTHLLARLALPDRYQRLPRRSRPPRASTPGAARSTRLAVPTPAARRAGHRDRLARTLPGHGARRPCRHRAGPGSPLRDE